MFKTIIIFVGFLTFCYINRDKALKDYKEKPKDDKPKKENHSPYSEEEMDKWFLREWQKDLVRQGRFAPWSFKKKSTRHEPLSDGQYHKDDDVGKIEERIHMNKTLVQNKVHGGGGI